MSYPAQLVYVDLQSSQAFATSNGQKMSWPTFVAGGIQNLAIRFLTGNGSGGYLVDNQYSDLCAGLRGGLGLMDYAVEGGHFRISLLEGTTAPISYSASAKRIEDALNALVSSNPFTCEQDATGVFISRADGSDFNITSPDNTLIPASFIRFRGQTTNGRVIYKMTFEAAPLAFSTGLDRILPPAPQCTVIQHGGADASGAVWPTIHNLYIPPTFQGTFQLSDGIYKSDLMDITDGASQIESYLNTMWKPKEWAVTVTNPTSFNVHITYDGKNVLGVDVPALEVAVYSAPPADCTFLLNLDTIPLQEYLRGQNTKTLQFEAEADFYVSKPIEGQPLPATYKKKLWSVPVTVAEPLIRDEFQTPQAIEWLEPPSGKTYVPFTRDQIITGQQSYTTALGDGSASSFILAHNLNTDAIASVLVRENKSPGRIYSASEYELVENDANSLLITFAEAPPVAGIAVTVTAAGPVSSFQAHTHTIEQVVNLKDRLNDLSKRIAYLENLVPSANTISVTTNMPDQINVFPSFGEILPDLALENTTIPKAGDTTPPGQASIASQIVTTAPSGQSPPPAAPITVVPGTDLLKQTQDAQAELAKIQAQVAAAKAAAAAAAAAVQEQVTSSLTTKASQNKTVVATYTLPGVGSGSDPIYWPPMRNGKYARLPSAREGSPISVSAPPNVAQAGIYQAAASFSLAGLIPGRKGFVVSPGDRFASDGVIFYKAASLDGNFFYPVEMDRELARLLISKEAFPTGSFLGFDLDITTSLRTPTFDQPGINNGAEYLLKIQATPISRDMIPGNPSTILSCPISFSAATQQRIISISARRDGSSSSALLYGRTITGDAIPEGDFALSVLLTQFDVDNTELPVGQLGIVIPSTKLTISNG